MFTNQIPISYFHYVIYSMRARPRGRGRRARARPSGTTTNQVQVHRWCARRRGPGLAHLTAYEAPKSFDFINNRNYLALSNLEEDLRNNQGLNYGTVEYNLGVNSALKNISSFYTSEINLG